MGPSRLSPLNEDQLESVVASVQARLGGARRAEWVRWVLTGLVTIALSIIVAYYTATTQIEVNKTTEQNHFDEILRRLDVMQTDIRDLRTGR